MVDLVSLKIRSAFENLDDFSRASKELRNLASEFSKTTDATQDQAQEAERLAETLGKLKAEQKLIDKFRRLTTSVKDSSEAMGQAEREAAALRLSLDKAGGEGAAGLSRELTKAGKKVQTLAKQQQRYQNDLKLLRREMGAAGTSSLQLARRQSAIKVEMEGARAKVAQLTVSLQSLHKVASKPIPDNTEKFRGGVGRAADAVGRLGLVVKGFVVAQLGRLFITANNDARALAKGLELVTGSAEAAAKEIRFVRDTADQLGTEVILTGKAYLDLTAAAKGTTLEGEQTRQIFTAISRAMSLLGKSAADTEGALRAVQQMISKGKVSAEELRGQLGERLPGALQTAARAIGVTTAELDGMLKKGELVAEDLLPKLAEELNKTFDTGEKIGGFIAAWNRLTNTVAGAFVTMDKTTGAMGELAGGLDKASSSLKLITAGFALLGEKAGAAKTSVSEFGQSLLEGAGLDGLHSKGVLVFSAIKKKISESVREVLNLDENLNSLGVTGKEAGKEIADSMTVAGIAVRDAVELPTTRQKNTVFARMMEEVREVTEEGVPEFVEKMAAMRTAELLTDGQTTALRLTLVELQRQIKNTGGTIQVKMEMAGDVPTFTRNFSDMGSAAETAGNAVGTAADDIADAGSAAADSSSDVDRLIQKNHDLADRQNAAMRQKEGLAEASNKVADAQEAENAEATTGVNLTAIVRQNYYDLSEAAGEYFDEKIKGLTSIREWWHALSDAEFNRVKERYEDIHASVDALTGRIKAGTATQAEMALAAQHSSVVVKELGEERLGALRSALADASSRADALADSARATLEQIQDRVDPEGADARRAAREKTKLEERYQEAVRAGNIEAQELLRQAIELQRQHHDETMGQLAEEEDARRQALNPPGGILKAKQAAVASGQAAVGPAGGVRRPIHNLPATDRPPSEEFLEHFKSFLERWRPPVAKIELDGVNIVKQVERRMRLKGGTVAEAGISDAALALGHRT